MNDEASTAGCVAINGWVGVKAVGAGDSGDFEASRLGGDVGVGVASLAGDWGLMSRPNSSFPALSPDGSPLSALSRARGSFDGKFGLRGGLYGLTSRRAVFLFGGLRERLRRPLYEGLLSSLSLSR